MISVPSASVQQAPAGPLHLRAAGVSLLLDLSGGLLPRVLHWGADLGDLSPAELDAVVLAAVSARDDTPTDLTDRLTVLPEHASAWVGRPGAEGSRAGRDWSPAFRTQGARLEVREDGTQALTVPAEDPVARLGLELELELAPSGLVRLRATLVNLADEPWTVGGLRLALPLPAEADELMDFTGRHATERVPQRLPWAMGVHAREVRTGRTGLDSYHVLVAGRTGFGFRAGEVWGIHLGWSGNQDVYAERLWNGARLLGGGELLGPAEVVLGRGESYRTPWLSGSYGSGTDALAARFHAWLRARPAHPVRPRPVIVNTWEAVYFDHDLDRLRALADRAAAVGAERFVLDDGWFGSRRDDTSGLGDWVVSADAWPDGLGPLVDHVRGLGMEFGLWVEPEMVNLDSDLARAHPEWLFGAGGRQGLPSRKQYVLDLAHPGAYASVRDQLLALLREHDIAYLKWDHNRYLVDAGHSPGGEPGVHAHTLAVYRLMAEIRAAHPGLEIESCASGGGRVDLGVLEHTDRVWASDCIDALERQRIQRWTQLLLPPELIGTHVGSPRSHTTRRVHDLQFRAGTALWGHMGIEWDLTAATDAELDELRAWIDFHKSVRPLLHGGTVVNADHPDPAIWVSGVVAADGSEALYGVTAVARSVVWPPGRVRLPGLDPDRAYTVTAEHPGAAAVPASLEPPPWAAGGVTLPGRALSGAGVQLHALYPEHLYLLRARAADGGRATSAVRT